MHKYTFNLKSLSMENFRGFNNVSINFDEKLTVLAGVNGSGKTSVLDMLAYHLAIIKDEVFIGRPAKLPHRVEDIRNGTMATFSEARFTATYPEKDPVHEDNEDTSDSSWEEQVVEVPVKLSINFKDFDYEPSPIQDLDEGSNDYATLTKVRLGFQSSYRGEEDSLPILVYYGGSSISTEIGDIANFKILPAFGIYEGALEPPRFSFKDFYYWFDQLYREKLQGNEVYELSLIEEAMISAFSDEKHQHFNGLKMKYSRKGDQLVLLKGDTEIDIKQASSGEKVLFAMVADLAKRLIEANPSLKGGSDSVDENPLKQGHGIVLIDEIDLHLHPKWQRVMISKLTEIFPNVQFVVTTHSPAVLSFCKPNQVNILTSDNDLQNIIIQQPSYSKGHSLEYILSEIMDTETFNPEINEYLHYLRNRELDTPRGKELQEVIDALDPNSPEKMRVNFAIQRFKTLGK